MGTRGIVGVIADGKIVGSYNHFDSYPESMGKELTEQIGSLISNFSQAELKLLVKNIRVISNEESEQKVSDEDYTKFHEYYNGGVDQQRDESVTWYQLLREAQGNVVDMLKSGVVIDSMDFVNDSLFCEWGWFLNFNTMSLEVYQGFQEEPNDNGRFAVKNGLVPAASYEGGDTYYPIALVAEIPFMELGKVIWDSYSDEEGESCEFKLLENEKA